MAACNKNDGRSVIQEMREEMAGRENTVLKQGKITTYTPPSPETATQRQARHAAATGTTPRMWR